jgi:hypothetical protein
MWSGCDHPTSADGPGTGAAHPNERIRVLREGGHCRGLPQGRCVRQRRRVSSMLCFFGSVSRPCVRAEGVIMRVMPSVLQSACEGRSLASRALGLSNHRACRFDGAAGPPRQPAGFGGCACGGTRPVGFTDSCRPGVDRCGRGMHRPSAVDATAASLRSVPFAPHDLAGIRCDSHAAFLAHRGGVRSAGWPRRQRRRCHRAAAEPRTVPLAVCR